MRLPGTVLLAAALLFPQFAQAQARDPYQIWSRVLQNFVDPTGKIDFRALAGERGQLDLFLAYVARISPRSAPEAFPDRASKLAYYINAYNALAMSNVIDAGIPQRLNWWRKIHFFGFARFTIGGERLSLYTLENDIIRPLGDERVHFALNCMVAGCPRLPRFPFTSANLDRQLDEAARQFFAEARNLKVFPERKRALVSAILDFYTEDFIAKSPTLLSYVNRYAPIKVPEDFALEFMDYDWTVNDRRNLRATRGSH